MTMKKKLLTTLSVVLILGLAALGILAYLTDTDSDVNVMTLGEVDIDQTENFVQKSPLDPGVTVEKEVTVENVGKSDAYVRTWFAFEAPVAGVIDPIWADGISATPYNNGAITNIDGEEYVIYVLNYGEMKATDPAVTSLTGVKMSEKATNADVAQYGDTYEVLVFSQAGQVTGFADGTTPAQALDIMFGPTHPWEKTVFVGSEAELAEAIEAGKTNIVLKNDITVKNPLNMQKSYTLDFAGNTLFMETTDVSHIYRNSDIIFQNGTLDISGVNIPDTIKEGIFYTANGSTGHADGNGALGNTFTFDNMLLTGEGYYAYSVIMLRDGVDGNPNVINFINGSKIDLKNETCTSGGVFKGVSSIYKNAIINITDSTIDCENITRLFLYGTVNVIDSTIKFIDSTNTSNAFRQGVFTIDGSNVTIKGGDKGISPRFADTVIKNNSIFTIDNVAGNDVIFEYDFDILVDATSSFAYKSVSGTAGGEIIEK